MTAPTLPGVPILSLEAPLPRLPSPESLVQALAALGLGTWEVRRTWPGITYAHLVRGELEVCLRMSPFRQGRADVLELTLEIAGPGFRGDDLGASNKGQAMRRILPPIPCTDAAAGDVLRTLERFKLPALVAALEVE